jgi:hypothetical protein
MRKIISLFQRNYDGDGKVRNEIVPGAEWVIAGEGVPTRKWDGTCCMIRDGVLYKRYDRKRNRDTGEYKAKPEGWEQAQDPDAITGHWPGWVSVGDGPEDQWHREALDGWRKYGTLITDGTFELCGPKVQGNPEGLTRHSLIRHGMKVIDEDPRDYESIRTYLATAGIEGIVWHHEDGRMVKIKAKDFPPCE